MDAVRRGRQPGHLQLRRLSGDLRRRGSELRTRAHGDTHMGESAWCQGRRRVRHDRVDSGGAQCGDRCTVPARGSAHGWPCNSAASVECHRDGTPVDSNSTSTGGHMALTEPNTDEFSLQQRYEAAPKQILVTGIQAVGRLPIDLMRADRAKGWKTAAFIPGYQGSPLGGYDRELQSQRKLLDELDIVHVPGLNEEIAATSVFGSQTAQTYDRPKYEGVAGIWYGKSPGLDRAGDAIRHGSFGGTARKGGVVLLVGDDAAAKP